MPDVTYYVALPFTPSEDGPVAAEPVECANSRAAVLRAGQLAKKDGHVGALAFSRSGDLSSGTFEDATIITSFGDVPRDLNGF